MIDYIWHSVAIQIGLGGTLVAGLLAAAYFLPPFRRWFIGAAGIVMAFLLAYAKGAKDAKRRADEKQAEAERQAIARGNKARDDAKRDVAAGRVRDKWDRDDI